MAAACLYPFTSPNETFLGLDSEKNCNFNTILNHHITNSIPIHHLFLSIDQPHLSTNPLPFGPFGSTENEEKVELDSKILEKFLQMNQSTLRSVKIYFPACCEKEIRSITNHGRALLPLQHSPNLHTLVLDEIVFKNANTLSNILTNLSKSLHKLHLSNISFIENYKEPPPFFFGPPPITTTEKDFKTLFSSISTCTHLVNLSLAQLVLNQNHLSSLQQLQKLTNLRVLELEGVLGDSFSTISPSKTLQIISKSFPNLQYLSVNYLFAVPWSTVSYLLNTLKHLRSLTVTTKKQPQHLENILSLSSSLMFFRFGGVNSTGLSKKEEQQLIEKMGGRVLICGNGIVEVDKKHQTKKVIEEYKKTEEVLQKGFDTAVNPNVWNEWEGLFNETDYSLGRGF